MKRRSSILLLSLFVLAALGGWLSTRSTLFRFSQIKIRGSEDADLQSRVRERLAPYLGRSLASLPLRQLEQEISQVPWVRSVALRRQYPSTIEIRVQLLRPSALAFKQGQLWVLDEQGRWAETLQKPRALPLWTELPGDTQTLRDVSAWIAESDAHELPDEVAWNDERGLSLRFVGQSLDFDLGHRNFDAAWLRAQRARDLLARRGVSVSFLDASYERRVVARLRNPASGLNLSR